MRIYCFQMQRDAQAILGAKQMHFSLFISQQPQETFLMVLHHNEEQRMHVRCEIDAQTCDLIN